MLNFKLQTNFLKYNTIIRNKKTGQKWNQQKQKQKQKKP